MNNEDLTKIVESRLKCVSNILIQKGKEYSTFDGDRLENFKFGAIRTGKEPIEVLRGYMLKHEVSFDVMCEDFRVGGKADNKMIDEKITDLIAYLLLAECIMKEEQVNTSNMIDKLKEIHV